MLLAVYCVVLWLFYSVFSAVGYCVLYRCCGFCYGVVFVMRLLFFVVFLFCW